MNPGPIWLDRDDASAAIEAKLRAGELTEAEAANLSKFGSDGYFTLHVDLDARDAKRFDDDVDRLWRERPGNVTFAYDSPPIRFSEADAASQRKPRYRIHDLHSASDVALRLYLDQTLNRYAALILGEPAVATQSLYFEFGSQQALHRDSIVVPTPQFGALVASWIALEDIDPASGALAYVPQSQKLPFYEFRPGEVFYDPTSMTGDDVVKAMQYYDAELQRSGLPTKLFLAKRGDVLIWHSALMHGGGPVTDETKTRKSFVVHYGSRAHHGVRDAAVRERIDGVDGESVFTTTKLLERGAAAGFANPLDGDFAYRR